MKEKPRQRKIFLVYINEDALRWKKPPIIFINVNTQDEIL